jgi:hypothetical protein
VLIGEGFPGLYIPRCEHLRDRVRKSRTTRCARARRKVHLLLCVYCSYIFFFFFFYKISCCDLWQRNNGKKSVVAATQSSYNWSMFNYNIIKSLTLRKNTPLHRFVCAAVPHSRRHTKTFQTSVFQRLLLDYYYWLSVDRSVIYRYYFLNGFLINKRGIVVPAWNRRPAAANNRPSYHLKSNQASSYPSRTYCILYTSRRRVHLQQLPAMHNNC